MLAALLIAILALIGLGAALVLTSRGSLSADRAALASVGMPFGGGTVQGVSVVTGPHSTPVPVTMRGHQIWPTGRVGVGQSVTVDVTIKRPGWVAWLAGKNEHLQLQLTTPSAHLAAEFVTLKPGAQLTATFTAPVTEVEFGSPGHFQHQRLATPSTQVTLPHSGAAGTIWVAAIPRMWETAKPAVLSYFPAGATTAAVASPAPGTVLKPSTPITLTFSKPIAQALGHSMPPVMPVTQGVWRPVNDHTIIFKPEGYGYGLGAHVTVALPAGINLVGGAHSNAGTIGAWSIPRGSTVRLQQMLSDLGYLPLKFTPRSGPVASTATAQEAAAIAPPAGSFDWAYPHVPSALRGMWAPGAQGEMTKAAVMSFENDHNLTADGDAGPIVWKALIAAEIAGHKSTFGYTFVTVDKNSQTLHLWHSGHDIMSTPVNTGIAKAPTASGTFAVYEHLRVTTMSGTNPDGSHYHDPGIQFVSYFNGGDALHAFTRAQYGSPQSLGCVEMPLAPAGQVWPYTPIGTLVHVA